jgi:hypothetical protein
MAVSLDLTQSGSASTKISASAGDTVTFLLASARENSVLANAVAGLGGLLNVAGVTFVASAAGNGSYALTATQSGSGSTAINAASGDTITLVLAATVENDVLAAANAYLQTITPVTGVSFAFSTAGNAS